MGVHDQFQNSNNEAQYVNIQLGPLLFQDDVSRLSHTVESAQEGNDRMEAMAERKLLDFNLDKSCVLVIGKKKPREELMKKVKRTPITLCGNLMKMVNSEKYLGDYLSHTLAESVDVTVNKRKGLVIKLIHEIRTVVDDFRANTAGGLITGLEIWSLSVLPFLLANSGAMLIASRGTESL